MNRYLALLLTGCAATIQGTVFVDRNGDHLRQADEPGLPGAVVAVDHGGFATTDANGHFAIDTFAAADVVWARAPTGFRPGPAWAKASDASEIAVVPLSDADRASPLTFVVAADSHMPFDPTATWNGGDLAAALDQATSLPEPPRFLTIVGDITQGADPAEYDRVGEALASLGVPFVPVPGNHDWFDGGAGYRARFGPDSYSFDVDGVHVVVWDTNMSPEDQIAFVTGDLATVSRSTTVVALGHMSPPDDVADALAALGVDYMFTGHWHANRRVPRNGMIEWGTQTFVMGGIDQSPAGYRVVTFDGGVPTIVHRERLVDPHLELVAPHAGSCASRDTPLVAAAALDASEPDVTARIDCGPAIALAPAGGWTFALPAGALAALADGTHSITLHATSPRRSLSRTIAFDLCASPATPAADTWAQLGGGPAHTGATEPIAPPLQVAWVTPIGGHALLGTPVVAGGLAVVATTNLAEGNTGGVVALDVATGAVRWRYVTPYPANGAPAIDGDTVVVTLGDGEIHALALADGSVRWTANVSAGLPSLASSLWAPPVIADGVVYAGVQFRLAAFDVATGAQRWHHDISNTYPWLGSRAAPAIGDGVALATFSRADGLVAYSTADGAVRWTVSDSTTAAINAAPVIDGGVAYVAGATGDVSAFDLATGRRRWTNNVTPGGFDWGYSITATPALANGTLFVPTQWNDLVALDAATGTQRWRYATPRGPLELAHYRSAQGGFAGSPIVAGDVVWIGRPDGELVALSAANGHELWSTALGSPIVSAPAPAGSGLIVAGYDGAVRALVPGQPTVPHAVAACEPIVLPEAPATEMSAGGGCCSTSGGGSSVLLALALSLGTRARRRARPASRRGCRDTPR